MSVTFFSKRYLTFFSFKNLGSKHKSFRHQILDIFVLMTSNNKKNNGYFIITRLPYHYISSL